ncbi:MAG: zf-TFIIB domain-containing protein [Deltaproteobacteria bacterium]|nr:zf-TFIIB domain-containing protein [Deltaproteobacteria bacterium]
MECPRDGVTLAKEIVEGEVEVDICPACAGVWLEPGELQAIEEAHAEQVERIPPRHDAMTAALEAARGKSVPLGNCPVCGKTMVREEYGLASLVMVDRCEEGHGVWLDKGELESIAEFYVRERSEARVPVLVQFLRSIGLKY